MSSAWKKGQKTYMDFMNKQKASGKSHAEALALWKERKGSTEQQKSTTVSTKRSKSKKKSKRESGFVRPKSIFDKLHTKTHRQRVDIGTIKRRF